MFRGSAERGRAREIGDGLTFSSFAVGRAAEVDVDHGNPGLGLVGFFTHEVAHPGRTNHINLHEKLADTDAAEFLT